MSKLLLQTLGAVGLAAMIASCGRALIPGGSNTLAPLPASVALRPGGSGLVVTPSKLAFTTKSRLVLTVSENGYHGKFTVVSGSSKVAKVSQSTLGGPGPVHDTVTAVGPGSTTITVSDSNHHKKIVPVSVTTAIVIINGEQQ